MIDVESEQLGPGKVTLTRLCETQQPSANPPIVHKPLS
jgi:hypothetical protein